MKTKYPEETSITICFAGGYSEQHEGTVADAMRIVERNASFATRITWSDRKEKNQATGCNYLIRTAEQMGSDNQPRHVGHLIIKGVTPER